MQQQLQSLQAQAQRVSLPGAAQQALHHSQMSQMLGFGNPSAASASSQNLAHNMLDVRAENILAAAIAAANNAPQAAAAQAAAAHQQSLYSNELEQLSAIRRHSLSGGVFGPPASQTSNMPSFSAQFSQHASFPGLSAQQSYQSQHQQFASSSQPQHGSIGASWAMSAQNAQVASFAQQDPSFLHSKNQALSLATAANVGPGGAFEAAFRQEDAAGLGGAFGGFGGLGAGGPFGGAGLGGGLGGFPFVHEPPKRRSSSLSSTGSLSPIGRRRLSLGAADPSLAFSRFLPNVPMGPTVATDAEQVVQRGGRGAAAAGKEKKKRAKTFPEKLMQSMMEYADEEAVAWLPDGKSFVIVNPDLFCSAVLNKVFKESKYASFVRKLHRWGFVRLTSGTGTDCFHHPMFQRNKKDMASKITCTPRETANDKTGKRMGRNDKPPSLAGVEKFIRTKMSAAASAGPVPASASSGAVGGADTGVMPAHLALVAEGEEQDDLSEQHDDDPEQTGEI